MPGARLQRAGASSTSRSDRCRRSNAHDEGPVPGQQRVQFWVTTLPLHSSLWAGPAGGTSDTLQPCEAVQAARRTGPPPRVLLCGDGQMSRYFKP